MPRSKRSVTRSAALVSALLASLVVSCSSHAVRHVRDDAGPFDSGPEDADVVDEPTCLTSEVCDNDRDDDCDGLIDEGCEHDECPPGVEVPTEEVCDGIDNDCDGEVDEEVCVPPPDDCECTPGSTRYCDEPSYDVIGAVQTCDDEMQWGPCREGPDRGPEECLDVEVWYSPNYEACLIRHGYCAQDMWDIDLDSDTWESLGACGGITCELPRAELCGDLFDNDFDGEVDEGCEGCLCLPGSSRWCDSPIYDGPGLQWCADDGLSWGSCSEEHPVVDECRHVGSWLSPEVELCMLVYGYCVQDIWDIDADGDPSESLGACADVACGSSVEEVCGNLFDDDRDGMVDEECGDCECSTYATRYCDTPTHGWLGLQECTDEHRWGRCEEVEIPDVCVAVDSWYSAALEACLIENDRCTQDIWDLDGDSDARESLGQCPNVFCP